MEASNSTGQTNLGLWILRALVGGVGGAVAATGWLPPHSPVLVLVGVAAILYLARTAGTGREAATLVSIGSVMFFTIINRPLVSAYGWGGWINDGATTAQPPAWWLLNGLWLLLSLWCSLFWTVVFTVYWWARTERAWIRVVGISIMWAGVAEWLRSASHWGFEWGFIGISLADVAALRQWSSVGGVLLLSSLLVGASAFLVELVTTKPRLRPVVGGSACVGVAVVWLGGTALDSPPGQEVPGIKVAALQFAPPVPPPGRTALGLSPAWFSALPQIVERGYKLIVLPESISSTAVQLDGLPAAKLGPNRQVHSDTWKHGIARLLPSSDIFLAVGVEGIEQGDTYNSTSIWNDKGLVGWQHKVHLVPFAEYLPRGWGFLNSQALTYYKAAGQYRPIEAGPFRIGSFICQEVQHAETARELTRLGANILITGGNDGVFADRRVAQVHHSIARIRATEVSRFILRAQKNGVTSIVSPTGEIISQSPDESPALIGGTVSLLSNQTLWARMGPWPVLLGTLGFLVVLGRRKCGTLNWKLKRLPSRWFDDVERTRNQATKERCRDGKSSTNGQETQEVASST